MAQITLTQWVQYLIEAGFQPGSAALATAAAIPFREAPGSAPGTIDTSAYNPISVGGQHASGPLQFLQSTFAHYANPYLPLDPTNPQSAAAAAFNVYSQTGGFAPWTCDVECGFPAGSGVAPSSPSTVIGANGQPIPLPSNFAQVTGYQGGNVQSTAQPQQTTGGGSSPSPLSGLLPNWLTQGFVQNVGVAAVGLVALIVGGLILAAPQIQVVAQKAGKKAIAGALT